MTAWLLILVSVLSGTAGDLLTAKSMRDHGEIDDFTPASLGGVVTRLAKGIWMIAGIVAQAVSFCSFAACWRGIEFRGAGKRTGKCGENTLRQAVPERTCVPAPVGGSSYGLGRSVPGFLRASLFVSAR